MQVYIRRFRMDIIYHNFILHVLRSYMYVITISKPTSYTNYVIWCTVYLDQIIYIF